MDGATAAQRFAMLEVREPLAAYNFDHFRTKHLLEDVSRTLNDSGIKPGALDPDFELPRAGGGSLRLGSLVGAPILLHFGSLS